MDKTKIIIEISTQMFACLQNLKQMQTALDRAETADETAKIQRHINQQDGMLEAYASLLCFIKQNGGKE